MISRVIKNCDMEMQDAEPGELAKILAMPQDELHQAHAIFMITVDNGQSDMKPAGTHS
jgi:hypothetical protein